jgi:hypothetical protein
VGVVATYLPQPLAGAAGCAQVSTVNGVGGVYELSTVVGVVRPLTAPPPLGSSSEDEAQQQQQRQQQQASGTSTA